LSTTYSVITGDTFASVSRRKYGTENEAGFIARANPGVAEPLTAGTVINTPALPTTPVDSPQTAPSDNENETAVLIDGKRFRFWTAVRITRAIDTMDTIELSAPLDVDAPDFRDTFRPFSYKPLTVTVGGDPLFTGTMVAVSPTLVPDGKTVAVSGYALPGVLNDCTPPASAFPLEFNDQGLKEIAATIAAPFGLKVELAAGQGAVFERVAAEPGKKALTFLADLAKQRNLVISSTPRGAVLFSQSVDAGSPVGKLQQGQSPVISVTPFFSPQEYYSHITGVEPVIVGLSGSQFTVKNPRLLGVTRPLTFNAPDTVDADVKTAVEAKAGRMYGNMAAYSVRVSTWRDPSGKLWTPNTTVILQAKDAMIYSEYEFVIRSIEFVRERAEEFATLDLVVPGAFSGKIPEALPWDE
jgi:prophage tail gpP-like protein